MAHEEDVNMEAKTCSICRSDITAADNAVVPLGCTIDPSRPVWHYFHQNCITPHARRDGRCPICRRDIRYLMRRDGRRALVQILSTTDRTARELRELQEPQPVDYTPYVFYPEGAPELGPPQPMLRVIPQVPVGTVPGVPLAPPPLPPMGTVPVVPVVPLAPPPEPLEPENPLQGATFRRHQMAIKAAERHVDQLIQAFTDPITVGERQPLVIPTGQLDVYRNQTISQFATLKNQLIRTLKSLKDVELKIEKMADRNYVERVKAEDLAHQEGLRQQAEELQARLNSIQDQLQASTRPRRRQRTT